MSKSIKIPDHVRELISRAARPGQSVGGVIEEALSGPAPRPLAKLTAEGLVKLNVWAMVQGGLSKADRHLLGATVAREAEARDWPEGWYEDPSGIPEMADG